jgi:hypothetical protein
VPAAAVIPAPMAYIKAVAVKGLVELVMVKHGHLVAYLLVSLYCFSVYNTQVQYCSAMRLVKMK